MSCHDNIIVPYSQNTLIIHMHIHTTTLIDKFNTWSYTVLIDQV